MPQAPNYLREGDAAAFLGLSPKTLSRWRWAGGRGPSYGKFGSAVRYSIADLERFAAGAEVPQ